VFEIPRDAFSPPPEVTSALVTLRLPGERAHLASLSESQPSGKKKAHSSLDADKRFLDFVKLCFSQKRKTLVNNLRSVAKPAAAREVLNSLNLRLDSRAEQLAVSQLASLYSSLSTK
jgi:16S rRNA A1518/A1519 N6-dimethyltransferase RsmA/KsgA/DIM1 with predicted DNA glycosylase/AP lyase activity